MVLCRTLRHISLFRETTMEKQGTRNCLKNSWGRPYFKNSTWEILRIYQMSSESCFDVRARDWQDEFMINVWWEKKEGLSHTRHQPIPSPASSLSIFIDLFSLYLCLPLGNLADMHISGLHCPSLCSCACHESRLSECIAPPTLQCAACLFSVLFLQFIVLFLFFLLCM